MRQTFPYSLRRLLVVTFGITALTTTSLWLDVFLLGTLSGPWTGAGLVTLSRHVGVFGLVLATLLLVLGLTPATPSHKAVDALRANPLSN